MHKLFQPVFTAVHGISAVLMAMLLAAHIGAMTYHYRKWRE